MSPTTHFWYRHRRPHCEPVPGDIIANTRDMRRTQEGAPTIMSAGAHSFDIASDDNMRLRPVEVLVGGDRDTIVSRPETFEDRAVRETTV